MVINYTLFLFTVYTGPDNSSVPVCLGCYRKVNGSYRCPGCKWPLCSGAYTQNFRLVATLAYETVEKPKI